MPETGPPQHESAAVVDVSASPPADHSGMSVVVVVASGGLGLARELAAARARND
jgi:hypothetical protein